MRQHRVITIRIASSRIVCNSMPVNSPCAKLAMTRDELSFIDLHVSF